MNKLKLYIYRGFNMSRGKEFVFSIPVKGMEEVTVFAETIEKAIEKINNGELSTSYVSEVYRTEIPSEDHLIAERGDY